MKIYSNRLTEADVRNAFRLARENHHADIYIEAIRSFKPRNYANGVEVFAESTAGKRATGHVPARATGPRDWYPRAASWDDWGYVIAYLFNIDPHARIGFYDSLADFIAKVQRYPRKGSELPFLGVLEGWST
jgi:hypothetical protein